MDNVPGRAEAEGQETDILSGSTGILEYSSFLALGSSLEYWLWEQPVGGDK